MRSNGSGRATLDRRTASIFTHLVNFCWSFFKWCLLLAFVGSWRWAAICISGWMMRFAARCELRFANHYRDFRRASWQRRFDPERGIAIDNFSLTPKTTDGSMAEPLLSIDELYLAGNMRIEQLVTNQMQIDDVVVRHANLRIERKPTANGTRAGCCHCRISAINPRKITIEDASATVTYSTVVNAKPGRCRG